MARPFTRMGKPTYEQKEKFTEEADELAMSFTISYPWAGQHGLLAKVMGAHKYHTKTDKNHVPPVRPPAYDPRIIGGGLSQAASRVAQAMNDTANVDYAVIEGFREGFGEKSRKAFDLKYYKQLWEEMFKYKRVLPITCITHLKTRHVIMDTRIIKCLIAKALRDWREDKHISSFVTRLTREQRRLSALSPSITITDEDKLQKTWRRCENERTSLTRSL